jgi:hypothetical protein
MSWDTLCRHIEYPLVHDGFSLDHLILRRLGYFRKLEPADAHGLAMLFALGYASYGELETCAFRYDNAELLKRRGIDIRSRHGAGYYVGDMSLGMRPEGLAHIEGLRYNTITGYAYKDVSAPAILTPREIALLECIRTGEATDFNHDETRMLIYRLKARLPSIGQIAEEGFRSI